MRAAPSLARNAPGAWRQAHRRPQGVAPSDLRSRSAALGFRARLPCAACRASVPRRLPSASATGATHAQLTSSSSNGAPERQRPSALQVSQGVGQPVEPCRAAGNHRSFSKARSSSMSSCRFRCCLLFSGKNTANHIVSSTKKGAAFNTRVGRSATPGSAAAPEQSPGPGSKKSVPPAARCAGRNRAASPARFDKIPATCWL